jgi:hypothetical protein
MEQTFFDRQGSPVAYSDDKRTIYLFSGRPAAYIEKGSVFAFSGKHLGTLNRGWVRDNDGQCVFFTEKATRAGGPPRPTMRARPAKNVKKPGPFTGIRQRKPEDAPRKLVWSQASGPHFFEF